MRETARTKKLKEAAAPEATGPITFPIVNAQRLEDALMVLGDDVNIEINGDSLGIGTQELLYIFLNIPDGANTMVRTQLVEGGVSLIDEQNEEVLTLRFY